MIDIRNIKRLLILVIIAFVCYKLFYPSQQKEHFISNTIPQSNSYILVNHNNLYLLVDTKKKLEININPRIFKTIVEYKKYSKKNNIPVQKPVKKSIPQFLVDMLVGHIIDEDENKEEEEIVTEMKKTKNPQVTQVTQVTRVKQPESEEQYSESEVIEEEVNNEVKLSKWINDIENKLKNTHTNSRPKYFMQPDKNTFTQYGQSFMPPTSWSVPQERPPPCIPQKNCPVCPVYTPGAPVDALETTSVGSIMPKFTYKEVYNKDYYHPGWISGNKEKLVKNYPKYDSQYSMYQKFVST